MEVRYNGRLYKKEGTRWYVDSRKRWRPVYDINRLEILRQLEKGIKDERGIEVSNTAEAEKAGA